MPSERTGRGDESKRARHAPEVLDDDTIRLYGVGPTCPGCGGPTHAVTADDDAERPWWCQHCNVRLDDEGGYGSAASWPSGSEPIRTDGGVDRPQNDVDSGIPDMDEIDWGPVAEPLEDGDPCPECGYLFDNDEWTIRKLPSGPTIGETWVGYCPGCEQRTYQVGT